MAMPESDHIGPARRGTPRRKAPKKATARHLENAGRHYLGRFASSAVNFRRVMMRKVDRSARAHGTDREEGAALVDELVARFAGAGLLDDGAYARGRALTLLRRGASRRAIRSALRTKGVGGDDIDAALARLADEAAEPELAAALTYARRRRLGPYRAAAEREAKEQARLRQKDLAALARAGFGYGVAREVIEAVSPEEIEARAAALQTG